jgi:serine/threonine-protein kinase HipA
MRNHGFLYMGNAGWALSPAYDLNPMPLDVKPRILSTAIDDEDQTASLALALSVAEYFGLDQVDAQRIAGVVGRAVAQWRTEAIRLGISKAECMRMESAFAHADLEMALGFA